MSRILYGYYIYMYVCILALCSLFRFVFLCLDLLSLLATYNFMPCFFLVFFYGNADLCMQNVYDKFCYIFFYLQFLFYIELVVCFYLNKILFLFLCSFKVKIKRRAV